MNRYLEYTSDQLEDLRLYNKEALKDDMTKALRDHYDYKLPKLRRLSIKGMPEIITKEYLKAQLRRNLTHFEFITDKPLNDQFFSSSLDTFASYGLESLSISISINSNHVVHIEQIARTIIRNASSLRILYLHFNDFIPGFF